MRVHLSVARKSIDLIEQIDPIKLTESKVKMWPRVYVSLFFCPPLSPSLSLALLRSRFYKINIRLSTINSVRQCVLRSNSYKQWHELCDKKKTRKIVVMFRSISLLTNRSIEANFINLLIKWHERLADFNSFFFSHLLLTEFFAWVDCVESG